jgi:microcystin-dependent protein
MASTYTTSLKIQQMGNGEDSGTWGTITNTNWNLIEAAVAGVTQITMANANYTLSNLNGTADEARSMVLAVGGTNSAIYQVIAPLVPKFYVVTNNTVGGYAITIGASTGAIITVPSNTTVQVYCDGTNFYSAQTSSAGNFLVNGTLTAAGETDTGNMSVGGTLGVTGASTFTGTATFIASPAAPTPTTGDNTTKVATTAFVQTAVSAAIISGVIQMWPTATAPSGWLICDGSAVSRTTYATLYALVGTTFGSGDGSTTFNLPNYQGNVPLGASGSYALASTGGSTDAIVVSHTHTASTSISDPGHNHTPDGGGEFRALNNSYPQGGGYTGSGGSSPPVTNTVTTGISASTSVSSAGSSGSGANLQPYLAINFIIKT